MFCKLITSLQSPKAIFFKHIQVEHYGVALTGNTVDVNLCGGDVYAPGSEKEDIESEIIYNWVFEEKAIAIFFFFLLGMGSGLHCHLQAPSTAVNP